MKEFVNKNAKNIHELLNFIWSEIFKLNEELKGNLKPLDLKVEPVEEVFNAYIFLDGEWKEMLYPHPAFEVKPQGEVGATIQGFYFVFGILRDKITKEFIKEFLNEFPKSYIYGSESFLEDIYNYNNPRNYEEVFEKIKSGREILLNFEVEIRDFENPRKNLRESLMKFINLAKKYNLLESLEEEEI